jgi:hypothetical protein
MLCDILRASLAGEADMTLVGEAADLGETTRLVERGGVDVVVLGLAGAELSPLHYRLFDVDARLSILAVEALGQSASLYELAPRRQVLRERSATELMQLIREQVRSRHARAALRAQD